MKLLLIVAAFVGLAVLAREAEAAEPAKPSKPVVCMSYAVAKTDKADDDAVAICYDGKKPQLFYRFQVVEVPGKEQGRVRVLVGWRV